MFSNLFNRVSKSLSSSFFQEFSLLQLISAVVLTLSNLPTAAHAEVDYDGITKAYIEAAFPPGVERLRKFEQSKEIEYVFTCPHGSRQKCIEASRYFRSTIFESNRMRLEQKKFGRLNFEFAEEQNLTNIKNKFLHDTPYQVIDADDLECQLYLRLDNDKIASANLVISLSAEPKKKAFCLLIGFYRALGLSQQDYLSFSDTWAHDDGLQNNLTLADLEILPWFRDLVKTVVGLQYIHSCPILIHGMKKSQVVEQLGKKSVCFQDIQGSGK